MHPIQGKVHSVSLSFITVCKHPAEFFLMRSEIYTYLCSTLNNTLTRGLSNLDKSTDRVRGNLHAVCAPDLHELVSTIYRRISS